MIFNCDFVRQYLTWKFVTKVNSMLLLLFRFLAVNVAITYIYFTSFQKVDEEEYGGISEILKEGLMTSFSSFLVSNLMVFLNI